jgi:hydroxypyruvate isomerase
VPRFAANLTMLYNELDFLDRFEAAAKAGFEGVEFLFPYDYPKEALAERLERNGLTLALHNLPAGDWAAGERGIGCLPGRTGEFQESVKRAIEYATALGCPRLNCLAGIPPEGVGREEAHATFIGRLRFAAAELERAGIRLIVEAINTRDIPGFFLTDTKQARALIEEVGDPNLGYQYDIYHMQIMEGDLTRTIEANLDIIEHVQLADNPGRHEPGTGEINYPFLFERLDAFGYGGWIGCEYRPRAGTDEGLGWFASYRRRG